MTYEEILYDIVDWLLVNIYCRSWVLFWVNQFGSNVRASLNSLSNRHGGVSEFNLPGIVFQ